MDMMYCPVFHIHTVPKEAQRGSLIAKHLQDGTSIQDDNKTSQTIEKNHDQHTKITKGKKLQKNEENKVRNDIKIEVLSRSLPKHIFYFQNNSTYKLLTNKILNKL